jgi:1-acyl-sn-glycerol-3-phosphate acyltransferase
VIPFLRTLAAFIFLILFIPFAALIAMPWTLITRNADFLYFFSLRGARFALKLAGICVETEGRELVPPGQTYIFMSNHVSNLDPPVLIPMIPGRTSVLVKKELFRVPIFGTAMRMGSLVPVDRSDHDAAIQSIGRAAEVLKRGLHMTIFIEGTRSRDGRLLPFKKGPFHLALESGVAIVPVTVLGTRPMMHKGSWLIYAGSARCVFHAPIDPKKFPDREALMDAVRQSIASALPEGLR